MPTVEQLRDLVRAHKSKNCPSFSKLKKAQLIALANELGLAEGLNNIPEKKRAARKKAAAKKTPAKKAAAKKAPAKKAMPRNDNIKMDDVADIMRKLNKTPAKKAPVKKTTAKPKLETSTISKGNITEAKLKAVAAAAAADAVKAALSLGYFDKKKKRTKPPMPVKKAPARPRKSARVPRVKTGESWETQSIPSMDDNSRPVTIVIERSRKPSSVETKALASRDKRIYGRLYKEAHDGTLGLVDEEMMRKTVSKYGDDAPVQQDILKVYESTQ